MTAHAISAQATGATTHRAGRVQVKLHALRVQKLTHQQRPTLSARWSLDSHGQLHQTWSRLPDA